MCYSMAVVANMCSRLVRTGQLRPVVIARSLQNKASQAVAGIEDIPGPRSLPLIGTLYNYLPGGKYTFKQIYVTGSRMMKQYGPIVRDEIIPGRVIVRLFNPDDIATVFRNEGVYPVRVPLLALKRYREMRGRHGGLATVSGPEWYKLRSLVQRQMMQPQVVASYLQGQEKVADDFVDHIRLLRTANGEVPNLLNELYRWAMESIGVVCFDQRIGALDMDNTDCMGFIKAVNGTFTALHKYFLTSFLHSKGIVTRNWRDLVEYFDTIWEYTIKYVDIAEQRCVDKDSLLLHLLATPNLKRELALIMVADLFAGGVDTTAHSLAFNLYHLARNPDKQEKLYQEIQSALLSGKPIDGHTLNSMSYLRACMKESNRITPTVVPGTMRVLDREVVLSGYRIPAGTMLLFHNDVICRQEKYFTEPHTYAPERWFRAETRNIHPFALLPFGHGPRMCIGRRFAEQEMCVTLIKILQHFRVDYRHADIGQRLRLVNMPDKPLRFEFIDRKL